MSTQSPQLEQADRELLVAYLDGELSSDDMAVVESRLASEASLRHELQELQQTWDALTELPRPVAAEDFTRTTLEMVAVAAQEDVESATIAMPVRRKRHVMRLVLLALAAALGGVLIARAVWPDRNDEIVENLPVIENIDAYRNVGSIEFLRLLHEQLGDDLARISPFSDEEIQGARQDWQAVSLSDETHRHERIGELDGQAAGKLQAKWQQFQVASKQERTKLDELHQQVLNDKESEQLFATMYRFGNLLSRHSAGDKAELRSKRTADEQLEIAQEWVQRRLRFLRPDRLELNADEKQLVRKWFQDNPQWRRRGRRNSPLEDEQEDEQRDAEERASLQALVNQLSESTQASLGDVGENQRWIIFRLGDAVRPSRWRRDDELQEFFLSDELDNDDRLRLLLQPEGEMRDELWRLYVGQSPFFGEGPGRGRGGGRGGERRGGRGGGRGGRRGGPPDGGGPPNGGGRGGRSPDVQEPSSPGGQEPSGPEVSQPTND